MGEDIYQYMHYNKDKFAEKLNTYVLNIQYPINRITYHRFYTKDRVNEIRKFTNGKNSLRGITNRDLFNNNFWGGTKKIILNFEQSTPIICFYFILLSEFDNLDIRLKRPLELRLKLINPNYFLEFDFIPSKIVEEEFNKLDFNDELLQNFEIITQQYNEIVKLIGESNTKDLIRLVNQKPSKIGGLYIM